MRALSYYLSNKVDFADKHYPNYRTIGVFQTVSAEGRCANWRRTNTRFS